MKTTVGKGFYEQSDVGLLFMLVLKIAQSLSRDRSGFTSVAFLIISFIYTDDNWMKVVKGEG